MEILDQEINKDTGLLSVNSLSDKEIPIDDFELFTEKNVSNIPFDVQVAYNIVKKHHIYLIRNIENSKLIPCFYNGKVYEIDKNYDVIRSFIKEELIEYFECFFDKKLSILTSEQSEKLEKYKISEQDKKKYKLNSGFINTLTKNIVQNIKDIRYIVKEENDFDKQSNEICLNNGIFDITSGILHPHSTDKLFLNIVNANYIFRIYKNKNNIIIRIKQDPYLFYKLIGEALHDKCLNDIENKKIVESFIEILASFLIGNNKFGSSGNIVEKEKKC